MKAKLIWLAKAFGWIVAFLIVAKLAEDYGGMFWLGALVMVAWWHINSRLDNIERLTRSAHEVVNDLRYPSHRGDGM